MKNYVLAMFSVFILSACGVFAYKQGATAKDLEQTKKICNRLDTVQATENCMVEHGWSVHKLDDNDLFATASYNENNQNASQNTKKSAAPTDERITQENLKTQSMTHKETNLLDTFTISSWWKIGGSLKATELAINECVATLGEAHRPNSKTFQVTRGLAICMREKGWRGLKTQ